MVDVIVGLGIIGGWTAKSNAAALSADGAAELTDASAGKVANASDGSATEDAVVNTGSFGDNSKMKENISTKGIVNENLGSSGEGVGGNGCAPPPNKPFPHADSKTTEMSAKLFRPLSARWWNSRVCCRGKPNRPAGTPRS